MNKERVAIGKRIKELRKRNKYSQSFIAQKLFISQAAYSLIENSQNGVVAEHIIKLSSIYDVTTDYLLTGNKLVVKMSPSNGFVPLIKADAHAGFIKNFQKDKTLEEYDWYRIPGMEGDGSEKMFEVEGRSMMPTLLPGDIIVCQTQPEISKALDGSVVLVITNESIFVKRLKSIDPDFVLLENDNREGDYEKEAVKIRKADIHELMMIRGKITHALAPQVQNPSSGKIDALEEAIELLKQELERMNTQLKTLQKS
jgi:transcriptional regulator with XRE-family HTH domain